MSCGKVRSYKMARQLRSTQNSLTSKLCIKSPTKQEPLFWLSLYQTPGICQIFKYISMFSVQLKTSAACGGAGATKQRVGEPRSRRDSAVKASLSTGTLTHFKTAGVSKQGSQQDEEDPPLSAVSAEGDRQLNCSLY